MAALNFVSEHNKPPGVLSRKKTKMRQEDL